MALNNNMKKKILKLAKRMPTEEIKTDKNGNITNWDKLSQATKNWIKNG